MRVSQSQHKQSQYQCQNHLRRTAAAPLLEQKLPCELRGGHHLDSYGGAVLWGVAVPVLRSGVQASDCEGVPAFVFLIFSTLVAFLSRERICRKAKYGPRKQRLALILLSYPYDLKGLNVQSLSTTSMRARYDGVT